MRLKQQQHFNRMLLQQRKALCSLIKFSSTAADLGDYENEERDAEYLTEQCLVSPQVSQSHLPLFPCRH